MTKKILSFFILILMLFGLTQGVFALTNIEKGMMLERFQDNKVDLIFRDSLNIDALDALDLFRSNNKIKIYENVLRSIGDEKENLERENLEVVRKIYDLEFQLEKFGKDIESLENETRNINSNIVRTKVEVKNKNESIKKTKNKIENNSDILRQYIAHIYKKGNLFLKEGELDNLKAILLSGKNIEEVMNDIYFKGLLAIAGKSLIQNHTRLIVNLYIEKKILEQEVINLEKFRKTLAIKNNTLNDKKKFKERILYVSKGKESLYKKYISRKIEVEKSLRLKAFGERIKFFNASKKLLGEHGCEFVDVLRNTPKSRTLSEECYKLNKIISLEAKLEENRLRNKDKNFEEFNIIDWPVSPQNGISAFFNDPGYKKHFGVLPNAIDIRVEQSTDIVAPLDGYVISIRKPTDTSYAFIALKHARGFVTVYGHISESLVEKYDFVKAGEVFAKTGGTFGTPGAGYISTGPHLHFEVLKNKVHIDPLKYMDISFLNFDTLPDHYKLAFFIDYKSRTGEEHLNKRNFNIGGRFVMQGANEIERQKYFLRKYARSDFANWEMWVEESLRWNIDPTFMMCIGLAESGLGRHLKTSYNVGNVGNVDSGGTWTMNNPRQGIWWIGHTLNNRFLGNFNAISQLSGYGRKGNDPVYATSPINWHRNVTRCMSAIKQQYIPDNFNFRTF